MKEANFAGYLDASNGIYRPLNWHGNLREAYINGWNRWHHYNRGA